VEIAFAAKLDELGDPDPASTSGELNKMEQRANSEAGSTHNTENPSRKLNGCRTTRSAESVRSRATAHLSVMPIGKTLRLRDPDHLGFVRAQPCMACGRSPSDAHHVKFAQGRALGRKVSDEFTVPLCRTHHRDLHRRGDERIWWQQLNLDPLLAALALWAQSHPALARLEISDCKRSKPEGQPSLASASSESVGGEVSKTQPMPADHP
jgi:hypothetical protein